MDGVPRPAVKEHVALQRPEEAAHGGLGQQVGAAALFRQLAEQVVEEASGGVSSQFGCFLQGTPTALQGDPDGFGILGPQPQASLAAAFAAAVLGNALEHPRQAFGQRVGHAGVPQPLRSLAQMQRQALSLFLVRRRLL